MAQELIKKLIESRLGNIILENKKQIISNIGKISSNAEDINKMQISASWITEGMAKEIFDKSKLDTSKFLGDFPVATGTTDAAIKTQLQTSFSHANKGDYVEVIKPTAVTGEAEYFLMTRGNTIADWTKGVVRTEHIKAGVAIAWANNANKLLTTDNSGNAAAFIGKGYLGEIHYSNSAPGYTYIGWNATGGVTIGSSKWVAGDSKGIIRHGNEQVTFEQIINKVKEPASSSSTTKIVLTKTRAVVINGVYDNRSHLIIKGTSLSRAISGVILNLPGGYKPKRLVAVSVANKPGKVSFYNGGTTKNSFIGTPHTETGAVCALYVGIGKTATYSEGGEVWKVYHSNGTQTGYVWMDSGSGNFYIEADEGTWAADLNKWWYTFTVEYEKEVTVKT